MPSALATGFATPDDGLRAAMIWSVDMLRRHGGHVLVFAPDHETVNANALLRAFARQPGIACSTWLHGIGCWTGGPVIAVQPDRQHLTRIADDVRTRALCVVPRSTDDHTDWAAATLPTLLGAVRGDDDQLSLTTDDGDC